jgi:glycosyltransferase involved in cell wall biosynthesis
VYPDVPIVVYSHLRWNFVFQRPQHVVSRLARKHRVLFIEEPVVDAAGSATWHLAHPSTGVTVACPRIDAGTGFDELQTSRLATMVHRVLSEHAIDDHLAWLYTPMALPIALTQSPSRIVYDCMDELSAFALAPRTLRAREADLLACADLVFTGGRSLYLAKRELHPSVHCFPSSVDVAHFRRALDAPPEPEEQRLLPHPRLGFFGVIDERFDRDVVDRLAESHPEWQIVIVGPVVKIDPATLPRRSNIHYTGPRRYEELPDWLAGWDVALLPFAQNEATRFISPTKTLEYMAAERPIVSTPIRDVAEPYGDIVFLAADPDTFVAACERALEEPAAKRAERLARIRDVLAQTSWDRTVAEMEALIAETSPRAALPRPNPIASAAHVTIERSSREP